MVSVHGSVMAMNVIQSLPVAQYVPALPKVKTGTCGMNTGIVGTGNSGRALAAYLSSQGHDVHILARSDDKLEFLGTDSIVTAEGKVAGRFPVASSGSSARDFAARSEVIFIATVTTAYAEIAKRLAPVLSERHKVILFSAKLGGTLLFEQALKDAGAPIPRIMETDALFACRVDEVENSIWIRGFKQWTLFSAATRSKTEEDAELIYRFFPGLSPATNIIQRGLTDFGAVAHATIALANMNLISRKTPFRFYYDGMTEETICLLESVEAEFRAIAAAYGSELIAMKDLLNRYYTCDTTSLYTAMTSVPNYQYSLGPETLQHRFLHEDICSTLVPASQLAVLAGLRAPIIDAIINITSVVTQRDLHAEGRNLGSLGLQGLSYKQVAGYVNS